MTNLVLCTCYGPVHSESNDSALKIHWFTDDESYELYSCRGECSGLNDYALRARKAQTPKSLSVPSNDPTSMDFDTEEIDLVITKGRNSNFSEFNDT